MKIIHIVPGSGNTFYCQNCLRDVALIKALRSLGHDVVAVPMYLPLFGDEPDITRSVPIFFGAVSTYMRQTMPFMRSAPALLDKLLNAPFMLKLAAQQAGSTQAKGLDEMTLSMLRGEHGNQAKDLERLGEWLEREGRADVLYLSNTLMLGLVRELKRRTGAAIVCGMQDEEGWVEAMPPDSAKQVWSLMAERGKDVDMFLASSHYYAERMKTRLKLDASRVMVVRTGVDLEGFSPSSLPVDPPVIGFLARMCMSTGLDILVNAFLILKEKQQWRGLKLRVAGGQTAADEMFLAGLRDKIRLAGFDGDVEFLKTFDRKTRLALLQSLTVLSVPVPGGDASGLYLLEAMGSGVPVVQPDEGAFGEIIGMTGGGTLYRPNNPATLASALESLLGDRARLAELAAHGRAVVEKEYSINHMAQESAKVYEEVRNKKGN